MQECIEKAPYDKAFMDDSWEINGSNVLKYK